MTGASLAEGGDPEGGLGDAGAAAGVAGEGWRGALESWAPAGFCTRRAAGNGSDILGAWPKDDPNITIDPKAAHAQGNGRNISKAYLSFRICSIFRQSAIASESFEEGFTGIWPGFPDRRWLIPRKRDEFVAWQATAGLL
jgi:hypothetical protein